MPIQQLEQRKRQKTLLIILLGVVVVTVVVLYFGLWKKTPVPQEQILLGAEVAVPQISTATEEKLKKINLDFEFLNEKIIPFLKIHGEIPVSTSEDEIGRDNPFIPY